MYYSTNPLVKTTCSRRIENERKAARIADAVEKTRDFKEAQQHYKSGLNINCFVDLIRCAIAEYLHLERDDRAKRLSALYSAVFHELYDRHVAV